MASKEFEDLFTYEEFVTLPIQTPEDTSGFALDIGSSLIKLAYTQGCTMEGNMKMALLTTECSNLDKVLEFIHKVVLPEVNTAKHKFFEACGLGFLLNKGKIQAALGVRFDETSEHACVARAFHFGMTRLQAHEDFVFEVTQLHLHKERVAKKTDGKKGGVSTGAGVPAHKTEWVYKADLDGEGSPIMSRSGSEDALSSPKPMRRAGSQDLLNPVSTGVPCGGGHWIHGQEDFFDPTLLKTDFPCLVCNMGSQFIYTVVDEEGIGKIVYRSEKGGLYFYGLGKLVTKAKDFRDLMRMVHEGETSHLSRCLNELPEQCHLHFDLQSVEEIQEAMNLAVQTDPFSKVISEGIESADPEDFAKTLHSSVCIETIGITNLLARLFKVNSVYYVGNFVRENEFFTNFLHMLPILDKVFQYPMTVKSSFTAYGGYLGAIGAALVGMDRINRGW